MTTKPSTSDWTQIQLPALSRIRLTTGYIELTRDQWLPFMSRSTQFNRIGLCRIPTQEIVSSTHPSTGIEAAFLSERIDLQDYPKIFNYDIYLIARTTDKDLFMSSPIASTDPVHHSSSPSTSFG